MKNLYTSALLTTLLITSFSPTIAFGGIPDKNFSQDMRFGKIACPQGKLMKSPSHKGVVSKEAASEDVITSPVGESQLFARSSLSVMPMGDTPMQTEDYNFAGILVFGDNGEVYLRNPFSQFVTNSYLEGEVKNSETGETLVFELPQQVMVYEADGEYYDLFACMLAFSADGESIELADNQDLEFTKVEDKWIMADPDAILGLTFDDSVWTGFAEMQMVYSPVMDSVAEVPDNLNYESWMLTYGNEGHFVELAVDGEKCYLKNMLNTSEESLAPIVGTVSEDGFSFPSPQFIGVNEVNSYLTYFFAGEVRETYIEDVNTTVRTFIPEDDMTFKLQEDGTYASSNSAMFTPIPDMENDYFWSMGVVEKPSLQKSVAENLTPADPSVVDYRYYPNYMFGYVSFQIPMLNTDGQILDTERLYYNVYLDGEILEFDNDEYPLFKKTMIDIPYNFEDGRDGSGDIKIEGSKRTVMLYREGLEELGVQSFYVDESGTKYYSELVTAFASDVDSKVEYISINEIESESYFDLSGREVVNPEKGVYVKIIRLKDGQTKTQKVIL